MAGSPPEAVDPAFTPADRQTQLLALGGNLAPRTQILADVAGEVEEEVQEETEREVPEATAVTAQRHRMPVVDSLEVRPL